MQLLHEQGYDWISESANFATSQRADDPARLKELPNGGGLSDLALATHGVNNGQGVKMGPVWSLLSGSEADRKTVLRTIAVLTSITGCPMECSLATNILPDSTHRTGSELCTVVEYMFSLEQSLAILVIRHSVIASSGLPSMLFPELSLTTCGPTNTISSPTRLNAAFIRGPWTTNGPESNFSDSNPNFGCCTANFHQGWPKFTASLFMVSQEEDLVACAYAPCEVQPAFVIPRSTWLKKRNTRFRGSVVIKVNPATPVKFALGLRIPTWADDPAITVNGTPENPAKPGSFARVEHTWQRGDVVEIKFPLKPRVSRWFNDSVAIERESPRVFVWHRRELG